MDFHGLMIQNVVSGKQKYIGYTIQNNNLGTIIPVFMLEILGIAIVNK